MLSNCVEGNHLCHRRHLVTFNNSVVKEDTSTSSSSVEFMHWKCPLLLDFALNGTTFRFGPWTETGSSSLC